MNKWIKIVLIGITMLSEFSLNAQTSKFEREEKKIFNEAESFYYYGDYKSAIDLYEKIEGVDPDFAELQFKLGESYYQLKRYEKAREHLKRGESFNSDATFYLAKLDLYFGNLISAEEKLTEFEQTRDSKFSLVSFDQTTLLMRNILNAHKFMSEPEIVNIINLGPSINTENSEYVPIISSDETFMVFTSRRIREGNTMDPTGQPFEDIYTSSRANSNQEWSLATPINGQVNTNKHDASVGLSPDGNRLFVYRSNENLIGGDLYESIYLNGKWTVPVRMSEKINSAYSIEPSASLSLDGKTFYFSSNREGGYGGFDIYRVILLPNGDWSLPKNLGPSINTKYHDDAPFIHPDGHTLYFSSKGHESMGGFDVFKSALLDEETWSDPENMGYPTNTTKDDIYFTISANEQHGYYSSDKKGGFGEHDIYLIDYLEKSLRQSVIKGKVIDEGTGDVVAANITIMSLKDAELTGVHVSDPEDGGFIFLVNPNEEFEVIVEADGFDKHIESVIFSVDQLRKTQKMEFKLNKSQASE
ncbi:MAG: tetratricopeptide repeat protein [Vicingaceae bacterium]